MTVKKVSDPVWLSILPAFVRNKLSGRLDVLAVLNNASWLLSDKFLRLFIGVFVSAWVARYLGPAEFGELAYILAYLAFFQAIATLGMDGIVVRDIAGSQNREGEILGTVFALRLIVGFSLWGLAIVGLALSKGWGDRGVLLLAISGGALIFQVADTVDLWFQSQSQSKRTVLSKMIAYLLSSSVKVLLILVNAPLEAFASVFVLDTIVAAIALRFAYRNFPSPTKWVYIGGTAKAMFVESWPFMLSALAIMIYMRIDQLMIGEMIGDRALGIYAAMIPFSSLWHVIPITLCVSLAPYIAKQKKISDQAYYSSLLYIFRSFLALSVVICIFVFLVADTLIKFVYGELYADAADVLKIHIFTIIPIFLGVAQGLWVLNERRSKIAIVKTAVGAICSVALNLILIPRFNLQGAAVAAVISQACAAVLINLVVAPKLFVMLFGFRWRDNVRSP